MTGGPITDGVYVLQTIDIYDPHPTCQMFLAAETLEISGGGTEIDFIESQVAGSPLLGDDALQVNGTSLTIGPASCGVVGNTWLYTATATTLVLELPAAAYVYTFALQ
jgi:hypothetical protein